MALMFNNIHLWREVKFTLDLLHPKSIKADF